MRLMVTFVGTGVWAMGRVTPSQNRLNLSWVAFWCTPLATCGREQTLIRSDLYWECAQCVAPSLSQEQIHKGARPQHDRAPSTEAEGKRRLGRGYPPPILFSSKYTKHASGVQASKCASKFKRHQIEAAVNVSSSKCKRQQL